MTLPKIPDPLLLKYHGKFIVDFEESMLKLGYLR
jgi:hypothetical protein